MAKSKRKLTGHIEGNKVQSVTDKRPTKIEKILTPTGDDFPGAHRLLPKIRYGKVSAEVFCKKPERRRELGLPVIIVDPLDLA